MKKRVRIEVKHLVKVFKIPHERHSSLKSTILNLHKRKFETFEVLNDVSFSINDGEFFGIVGRNGSGKSTLLKLIANIYTPTKGSIRVNGNLTPFIELGVGFNPELTGRENVFLNGAILGLTQAEIEAKYQEIVGFAELERFMDQKLKNYSSGMQVRLAFSIAIQAHNDILLIDEVLAVGDAKFQRKCFNVFKNIKRSGKTVILVTHDMGAVQEYCDRALLIDTGKIVEIGDISKVTAAYNRINFENEVVVPKDTEETGRVGTQQVVVEAVSVKAGGKKTQYLTPKQKTVIEISLKANEKVNGFLMGYSISDMDGKVILGTNTREMGVKTPALSQGQTVVLAAQFDNVLDNGTYNVSVAIKSPDRQVIYDQSDNIQKIEVAGWSGAKSAVHINQELEVKSR